MKTCPGCGTSVPEEATFCPQCGKSLGEQTEAPRYQNAPASPPPAAGAEPPAVQAMRRLFGSPLYLVVAIGYTVTVVSNLISLLLTSTGLMAESSAWMTALDGATGWSGDVSGTMNTTFWSSLTWSVVGQIPSILNTAALWMLYTTARDRSGAPFKTAGLTILRVLQIIILVMVGIMLALVLVLLGLALTTASFGENSGVFTPLIAMALFIVVVAVVLVMLYGIKFIATIDSFRKTIWTGRVQGCISLYVAVCAILGGILMLFNVPLGLLAGVPFTALSGLSGAVGGICFGVFQYRCHDEWQRLKAEQAQADGIQR